MKKIISVFFLSFLLLYTNLNAQDSYLQIKTLFDAPFHKLSLNPLWILDDQDKNSISFEHKKDDDVTFTIDAGKTLKKTLTIDKLYKQFEKAEGRAEDISALIKSFPEISILQQLLNQELTFENYSIVTIHGLKGIKAYCQDRLPIEEAILGNTILDLDIPDWSLYYFFIVNDRIYAFTFEAPSTIFESYEAFFETTLKDLF